MPTQTTSVVSVALVAAGVVALGASAAVAQPLPPPGPAGGFQQSTLTGTVQVFTLTPVGDLDGFLLRNGTEIHTPPHLTRQLAAVVQPGDQVQVQGWQSVTPGVIAAVMMTDARDGQSVVDQGPPPPGTMPPPPPAGYPAPGAQQDSIQGQIQQTLHGPHGDINGALLADGTQLRMPPPAAYQVASLLQPGQTIAAQGFVLSTGYGRVMDVQAAGPSPGRLMQLTPGIGVPPPPGGPGAPPPPPSDGAGPAPR